MSILSRLFGGGGNAPEPPSEDYKDFHITATPIKEGGTYRLCALIEKVTEGETRSHTLVRADTIEGLDAAQAASIRKARQVIDEQGDRIFG
jgi:hypothetical protein